MFIFYIGVQFIINASYYSSGSLTSCHVLEYCMICDILLVVGTRRRLREQ